MINRTDDEKYQLISGENCQSDGQFYTAVKTTGIYCLPSCSAKKPNRENVTFFDKAVEAEAVGFKPCKKCFPNLIGVQWKDFKDYIEIVAPKEFNFTECLVYLNRSNNECLHQVRNGYLYKYIKIEENDLLLKIGDTGAHLRVAFVNGVPPKWVRAQAAKYVWDLFDLQTDLLPFYELAANDHILKMLTIQFKGLRIVKIIDVFECLCWAVIGQQINLSFAYTLKKRLVEKYGEKLVFEGEDYYVFPASRVISQLCVEDLKQLQFSTRKAEYILGIAHLFENGDLKKEKLVLETNYETLMKKFLSIRGIGNWTADYTIMKCFNMNCAFPLADVGIHNALKGILGLDDKPTLSEIENIAKNWNGWEAYAAFYLWRWLGGSSPSC